MMNTITILLLAFLLTAPSVSFATRPDPPGSAQSHSQSKPNPKQSEPMGQHTKGGGGAGGGSEGGWYGPGGGFNIPGMGNGWDGGIIGGGYGAGYGGPTGGYSKGGVYRPTVVCKEEGPCYKKKLTCPAKCFSSYSHSGKNYGSGGGGGGCTIDCKKKCTAYC
ncbi:hypothetical protein NMG60_11012639 [Bertholletia excelsa]